MLDLYFFNCALTLAGGASGCRAGALGATKLALGAQLTQIRARRQNEEAGSSAGAQILLWRAVEFFRSLPGRRAKFRCGRPCEDTEVTAALRESEPGCFSLTCALTITPAGSFVARPLCFVLFVGRLPCYARVGRGRRAGFVLGAGRFCPACSSALGAHPAVLGLALVTGSRPRLGVLRAELRNGYAGRRRQWELSPGIP